jgi:hypothetical protein
LILDPKVENSTEKKTFAKADNCALAATSKPQAPIYAKAQGLPIGKTDEVLLRAQAPTVIHNSPALTPVAFYNGS